MLGGGGPPVPAPPDDRQPRRGSVTVPAEIWGAMHDSCHARGYHVLVGNAEHSGREGWVLSDILSADRVDGILLIGDTLQRTATQEDMARLVHTHRHVVSVGG